MQKLRFYDFFAGVGMVELALLPEWECAWANDNDPKKATIYRANHDSAPFHFGDVAEVSGSALPLGGQLAWASFPCQDLSLAGWRKGIAADRSGTFWQFYRIMSEMAQIGQRPPVIVLENVLGLLRGTDFVSLCYALESLGMQFGALVVDASLFVPQSRPRVFVVAVDRQIDCAQWVSATPIEPWAPSALLKAHRQLPKELMRKWRWWKLPEPSERVVPIELLIENEPQGVSWQTPEQTERLLDMMTQVNRDKIRTNLGGLGPTIGFLYKRTRNGQQRAEVRFDGLAGCLRTATGGSSRQTIVVVEDGAIRSRLISPREAARLMGVPDEFQLPAAYNDAYHAMGDGVAVPVVRWLSMHLLTPLAKTSLQSAATNGFAAAKKRTLASQLVLAEEATVWR